MNLEVDDFIELVEIAMERERDKDFFAVWSNLVPNMTKETYISFEEYRRQLLGGGQGVKTTANKVEQFKTDEEAIEDAENIIKMLESK